MENTFPSEADCLRHGRDYFNGSNGKERDYDQYAQWMQRGHELGYLNCSSELCECYAAGYGVPRDVARALELAHELEDKGFPLAWKHLALAYAEGHGVPLDRARAQEYARRLWAALARPLAGVDEDERYLALLSVSIVLRSVGAPVSSAEEYLRIARECMLASQQPERYAWYASALLAQLSEEEEEEWVAAMDEVRALLEKGVALGDGLSMYLLSVVLAQVGDRERVPELLLEASRVRQPAALGDILRYGLLQGEEAAACNNIYWALCNLGTSCRPREGRLPCQMRLCNSPFECEWRVHAKPGQEVTPLTAWLLIVNEGEEVLSDLTLRLCSADAGVDYSCELEQEIAPGEVLELSVAECEQWAGRAFGKEFYVELRSGERSAEMTLSHSLGLAFFHHKPDMEKLAPLQLWWEHSRWGGLVLCARCTKGELTGFAIARKRGHGCISRRRTLREGEVRRYGRWVFRSLVALELGEELAVTAEDLPLVLLTLSE